MVNSDLYIGKGRQRSGVNFNPGVQDRKLSTACAKMAADKEGSVELPRLFSRLQAAIEGEDDEKALEISKKILEVSPEDQDALRCQVVSLIHLAKFDSALQLIRKLNRKRKGGGEEERAFQLEEAYCLYRQDKYGETLSVLSGLPSDDVRACELQAQVAYKQEEYLKAQQTFERILSVEKDKEERVANYYAALSLTTDNADTAEISPYLTNTMEQCFNLACSHLVGGRGQKAVDLLRRAESLYRASLEEDGLTEEEIAEEMAVIEVQKGYCFHVSVVFLTTF